MNNRNRIWILGAQDPEMAAIESLLRECGEHVEYALSPVGERVTPATAYRCPLPEVPARSVVYAVECIDVLPDGWWVRIDHHRPGDPGYGRPPAEFLAASSIGQVIAELAKTGALRRAIPKEHEIARWMASHRDLPVAEYNEMLRTQWFWSRQDMPGPDPYPSDGTIARGVSWIYDGYAVAVRRNDFYFERRVALIPSPLICAAAADHCLGAAYRGECPGVDPDALMRWRVEQRATFQGRNAEQILEDIERARDLLSDPDTVELAPGIRVVDVRGYCVVTHDCGHKELQHEDYTTHLSHKHGCPGSPYTPRQWCNGWTVEPGIPELPDAAAREGVAYLATVSVDGSGRECRPKIVLGGCTTPEMVRAFLEDWAPAHGLVDCYGDPARGFAGGYLKEQQ